MAIGEPDLNCKETNLLEFPVYDVAESKLINPIEVLREELLANKGQQFFANDNISELMSPEMLEFMEEEATKLLQKLLQVLLIDTENDHNTKNTARRIAKMYVREVMYGRYQPMPSITDFPNAKNLDQLYTVGPITVRSLCSHHFAPILGKCFIGVLPGNRVIGLSKFNRIVDWIMARPQIQEEATIQIADVLEKAMSPRGLAVVVIANHGCLSMRGVKEADTKMTTSVMRGALREDVCKQEFLSFVQSQS